MPGPPAWAILFFLMLLTLGLDSQFALLETVTTAVMDRWPEKFDRKRKTFIILAVCVLFYLIGLILCTRVSFKYEGEKAKSLSNCDPNNSLSYLFSYLLP